MATSARKRTVRGLGPNGDEITDDDILEVDGAPPSRARFVGAVKVPPPSMRPESRYSVVVPRDRTSAA